METVNRAIPPMMWKIFSTKKQEGRILPANSIIYPFQLISPNLITSFNPIPQHPQLDKTGYSSIRNTKSIYILFENVSRKLHSHFSTIIVKLPINSEFIYYLTIELTPECFLKVHDYSAAFSQFIKDRFNFIHILIN